MEQVRPETLHLISRNTASLASPTPSYLAVEAPEALRFLTLAADGRPRLGEAPTSSRSFVAVEGVRRHGRPRLLLVHGGGARLRVNGYPAPCVVLLQGGDQLVLDGGTLQIGVHQAPPIGPVASDQVGKTCPFCLGSFEAGDQLYNCPCGYAVHHRSTPRSDGSVLECVSFLPDCRGCGRPTVLTEGWSHVDHTL